MCVDPATAINLAVTATSVVSAVANAQSQDNESSLLRKQAQNAKNEAAVERQEGLEEARKTRLKAILQMGDTKTQLAAGNIATTAGTALNALDTDKLNGDIEALSTIKSSENRAKKYLSQADLYYEKASLSNGLSIFNSLAKTSLGIAKSYIGGNN